MCVPTHPEEGIRGESQVAGSGFLELNSGRLEEQLVLLTVEPSLQSHSLLIFKLGLNSHGLTSFLFVCAFGGKGEIC